jgi:hypothetical protein
MSTIVTRAGKGLALTHNEVDANFVNLNSDKLQSGDTAAALTITSATINGGTITGTALNGTLGATTPAAVSATTGTFSGVVGTAATGAIITPVGTTGQRPAAASGMLRLNSTTQAFEGYNGSAWGSIGGGATGAGGDTVFNENSLVVTTSYTLTTGKSAMSVGAITINSGVTVTVPSGARWVIL